MASFVEQATLKVNDQSSAAINKINAELKKLFATAKSLKSVKVDIKVNTSSVSKAIADVNRLKGALGGLHSKTFSIKVNTSSLGKAAGEAAKLKAAMAGLHSQTVNIKTNVSGLAAAQRQIQQLRAAARNPITVTTRAGAGGGGAGGGGARAGAAGGGRGRGVLGNTATAGGRIANRFIGGASGLGLGGAALYTAAANVGRHVVEGAKTASIADFGLRMQQLDRVFGKGAAEQADLAIRLSHNKAMAQEGGAFFGFGQRQKMFGEVLGATGAKRDKFGKIDFSAAEKFTNELEEMVRINVGYGKSQEEAEAQTLNFAKGLLASGAVNDKITGQIRPDLVQQQFENLRTLGPTIGKELTGDFFRNMTKYLGVSKYPISQEAKNAVLLMGEESGTRAAVGYNQMVKQLLGLQQKKEQTDFLRKEGLLTTEKETYTDKRGRTRTREKGTGAVDAELLRSNAPAWIEKHLRPILEREGRAEGEKQVRKGEIRPEDLEQFVREYAVNPDKIVDLANKAVGERTARESLAQFLIQSKDIQRQLSDAAKRSGKVEDVRAATAQNLGVATATLKNQFEGAAGQMVMAAAPFLSKQMQYSAGKFAEYSAKFGKDEKTGAPTLPSGKDTYEMMKGMVPMALGAAVLGMTDPKTAPLAGAAFTLLAAGHAIQAAADKFLGKKPEDEKPGGDMFGAGPGDPGRKYRLPQEEDLAKADADLEEAKTALRKAQDQLDTGEKVPQRPDTGGTMAERRRRIAEEREKRAAAVAAARVKVQEAQAARDQKARAEFEAKEKDRIDREEQQKTDEQRRIDKAQAERAQIDADAKKRAADEKKAAQSKKKLGIKEEPKKKEVPVPKPRPTDAPQPVVLSDSDLEDLKPPEPSEQPPPPPNPQLTQLSRLTQESLTPKPTTAPQPVVPATTAPQPVVVTNPQVTPAPTAPPPPATTAPQPPPGGVTPAAAATSTIDVAGLQAAAGTFSAAASSFQSAFGTAAGQIQTAGQSLAAAGTTAANAISSGASSAGAKYGEAAAARISAAVANVTISVQHSGSVGGAGGSDTGTSTAGKQ